MPLFSIIIPTYNRAALLREALESVFAQRFTDYDVIVVDDGSTDETAATVASYGGRIRYVQQQNMGPGAARNLGLKNAVGEYIAFLDSDDLWFPWTLSVFHKVIHQLGRPSFISGTETSFEECAPLTENGASENFTAKSYADYYYFGKEAAWVPPSATAIKKDSLLAAGGFPERRMNYEESDLWLRLGVARGFVRVEAPPLFARRLHAGNITNQFNSSLRGIQHMVNTEQGSCYPGGRNRKLDRLRIITRHIRPFSIACARDRHARQALSLYGESFWWNLRLGRYKYILGFPLLVVFSLCSISIKRAFSRHAQTRE